MKTLLERLERHLTNDTVDHLELMDMVRSSDLKEPMKQDLLATVIEHSAKCDDDHKELIKKIRLMLGD